MADPEIVQLGTGGVAGRGSRTRPSAAARGLVGRPKAASAPKPAEPRPSAKPRPAAEQGTGSDDEAIDKKSRSPRPRPQRLRAVPTDAAPPEASTEPEPKTEPVAPPEPEPAPSPEPDLLDPPIRDARDDHRDDRIPPTVDFAAIVAELVDLLSGVAQRLRSVPVDQVRAVAGDPLRSVLELARRLGVDWYDSVDEVADFVRSRMSGTYAVDEFGFDPELTVQVYLPVLRWLAQNWFRVEVRGAENLPSHDAALLVSNHAGTLPLDGMILQSIVYDEIGRHVRMLGADLIFATPYSGDLARKTGTTLACQEDAERLLAAGQLVSVYPEGFKGLGKPYADRYKLQRFGRGGFVSAAVRAQVPIVPVSVVGSEEIYPLLSTAPVLARAMGVPYFPITPTFPWLGVLGMIPLPSKWIISFGEAITTDQLPAGAADDPMVVFNVTDQVRETIQQTLYSLLMQRRSAFF